MELTSFQSKLLVEIFLMFQIYEASYTREDDEVKNTVNLTSKFEYSIWKSLNIAIAPSEDGSYIHARKIQNATYQMAMLDLRYSDVDSFKTMIREVLKGASTRVEGTVTPSDFQSSFLARVDKVFKDSKVEKYSRDDNIAKGIIRRTVKLESDTRLKYVIVQVDGKGTNTKLVTIDSSPHLYTSTVQLSLTDIDSFLNQVSKALVF